MPLTQRATTLTIESIELFRNWCLGRGLSVHTAKAYTSDLKIFLSLAPDQKVDLSEIEVFGQYWLNAERTQHLPSTTNRRLVSLKAWAKWAGDPTVLADYVGPSTARGVAHPLREGKEGILAMADYARNAEQKAIVGLTGLVGCRISEARDTRPSWFDIHDMLLTVRGKGDKTRVVPISNDAWSLISEAYIDAKLSGDDRPLINYSDRPARLVITSLGRKAGISRPVASHDMRMTYGSLAFDHCKNIRVVQELLGHGSSSTTELYTGVTQAALREAVNF